MSEPHEQGTGQADAAEPAGGLFRHVRLVPGLHLVSTPIGNARDITLRALDTLASADVLAAEDTRTLRHLMDIHGVPLRGRRVLAYHDHNGAAVRPRLLAALEAGASVAYASEAGTPLVADPGFQLARAAATAGHRVVPVPGASAVLAALVAAGLPTDRFLFAGFLPAGDGARTAVLAELAAVPATLVIFESPRRVKRTLGELSEVFGEGRMAALCRELTKRFEEVIRGPLGQLRDDPALRDLRGEVVMVIDRAPDRIAGDGDVDAALRDALAKGATLRDAVEGVTAATGRTRRSVYARALALGSDIGDRE
ncbi:MAG TPA: 16S rRNA (cytidine(1402)-2'-O)-methyltransferase [Paracoccaceae bacterium]|nr:16S rRNA (cytidine(1402)-2'-O)-methyltransferase [Paracoccaceae bacterium]HMO72766.1 16S rRNA (cytidine(1402)-2'-O)-methyltransferase [Paracoccaceae bacterium]